MIYITQLIFLKKGEEKAFHQFESIVIPLLSNYRGKLLLRLQTDKGDVISAGMEKPDEVHLVSFETEQDYLEFCRDETRQNFLHLKEQSIRSVLSIKGVSI
ncbi:MAG: DUF1330 domain-containing protein [Segetibacter sp.]